MIFRRERWGVYLKHENHTIFINVPQLDWIEIFSDATFFSDIGVEHEVLILGYNKNEKMWVGSIKQAHPEKNPWINREILKVGKVYIGTATKNTEYGTYIELIPGVQGLIFVKHGDDNIDVGSKCEVEIILSEPNRQRIGLKMLRSAQINGED